jgi:hypothetical protein
MKVRFGKVSPLQANKTEISLYILQTSCTSLHILKTQLSFKYREFAQSCCCCKWCKSLSHLLHLGISILWSVPLHPAPRMCSAIGDIFIPSYIGFCLQFHLQNCSWKVLMLTKAVHGVNSFCILFPSSVFVLPFVCRIILGNISLDAQQTVHW